MSDRIHIHTTQDHSIPCRDHHLSTPNSYIFCPNTASTWLLQESTACCHHLPTFPETDIILASWTKCHDMHTSMFVLHYKDGSELLLGLVSFCQLVALLLSRSRLIASVPSVPLQQAYWKEAPIHILVSDASETRHPGSASRLQCSPGPGQ